MIDDILESRIDCLRQGSSSEDFLDALNLLPVDDERSLVLFGYLLCHSADILVGATEGVHWRF